MHVEIFLQTNGKIKFTLEVENKIVLWFKKCLYYLVVRNLIMTIMAMPWCWCWLSLQTDISVCTVTATSGGSVCSPPLPCPAGGTSTPTRRSSGCWGRREWLRRTLRWSARYHNFSSGCVCVYTNINPSADNKVIFYLLGQCFQSS